MAKTATTLFVGLAIGILGVLAYTRLRDEAQEEDVECLLRRISDHLVDLDTARQIEASLPE